MLQQTRVAAVLGHYERFLARFPNVEALARVRLSSVLAVWSGLGYYRRARLMHQASRRIVHDGFPADAASWQRLPGIGRYTAAAIASICHGERCAVVDGNVKRVLARLLGAAPRDAWAVADELLSRARPGDFNQAMMELGATVCTPRAPVCDRCPIASLCRSCANIGKPPRSVTTPRGKSKVVYGLLVDSGRVFLTQRDPRASVMPGLWELPAVSDGLTTGDTEDTAIMLRHSIMNTDYVVTVVRLPPEHATEFSGRWFPLQRAAALPLTGLARKVMRRFGLLNHSD